MSTTLPRVMAMLRHIPRYPRKIDTTTLLERLENAGYDISLRSIQRDLNELSSILPLMSDSARPQGWSWQADAEQFQLPFLDPQAALTFHLVERYLDTLLPESTLTYLAPWFRTAKAVLEANEHGVTQWPDKVRVLPRGLRLQSPPADASVHATLYDALLQERQVSIRYLQRQTTEPREYIVHPLGVVVRDTVSYLVCTMWEFTDVRQLALHRSKRRRYSIRLVVAPRRSVWTAISQPARLVIRRAARRSSSTPYSRPMRRLICSSARWRTTSASCPTVLVWCG